MAPADELADVLEKILHLYRPAIGKVIDMADVDIERER